MLTVMMTHKNRHRGNNPLISYLLECLSGIAQCQVLSGTLHCAMSGVFVRNQLYFATFSTVQQTIARIYASLIVAILTKIMAARHIFQSGSER